MEGVADKLKELPQAYAAIKTIADVLNAGDVSDDEVVAKAAAEDVWTRGKRALLAFAHREPVEAPAKQPDDEGFLARILLKEGESAAPDVAIAVICESEEDVQACRDAVDLVKPSLVGDDSPVVEAGTFAWQAYLAAGHSARACSNS